MTLVCCRRGLSTVTIALNRAPGRQRQHLVEVGDGAQDPLVVADLPRVLEPTPPPRVQQPLALAENPLPLGVAPGVAGPLASGSSAGSLTICDLMVVIFMAGILFVICVRGL